MYTLDPTASMSTTPALSNLATRESMALFVAVHARTRASSGIRCRKDSRINEDLPVPGGPCTIVNIYIHTHTYIYILIYAYIYTY